MTKFLGNVKVPSYELIVANMIDKFKTLECLLSLKIHFFLKNLGDVNEEQRFHLTKNKKIYNIREKITRNFTEKRDRI